MAKGSRKKRRPSGSTAAGAKKKNASVGKEPREDPAPAPAPAPVPSTTSGDGGEKRPGDGGGAVNAASAASAASGKHARGCEAGRSTGSSDSSLGDIAGDMAAAAAAAVGDGDAVGGEDRHGAEGEGPRGLDSSPPGDGEGSAPVPEYGAASTADAAAAVAVAAPPPPAAAASGLGHEAVSEEELDASMRNEMDEWIAVDAGGSAPEGEAAPLRPQEEGNLDGKTGPSIPETQPKALATASSDATAAAAAGVDGENHEVGKIWDQAPASSLQASGGEGIGIGPDVEEVVASVDSVQQARTALVNAEDARVEAAGESSDPRARETAAAVPNARSVGVAVMETLAAAPAATTVLAAASASDPSEVSISSDSAPMAAVRNSVDGVQEPQPPPPLPPVASTATCKATGVDGIGTCPARDTSKTDVPTGGAVGSELLSGAEPASANAAKEGGSGKEKAAAAKAAAEAATAAAALASADAASKAAAAEAAIADAEAALEAVAEAEAAAEVKVAQESPAPQVTAATSYTPADPVAPSAAASTSLFLENSFESSEAAPPTGATILTGSVTADVFSSRSAGGPCPWPGSSDGESGGDGSNDDGFGGSSRHQMTVEEAAAFMNLGSTGGRGGGFASGSSWAMSVVGTAAAAASTETPAVPLAGAAAGGGLGRTFSSVGSTSRHGSVSIDGAPFDTPFIGPDDFLSPLSVVGVGGLNLRRVSADAVVLQGFSSGGTGALDARDLGPRRATASEVVKRSGGDSRGTASVSAGGAAVEVLNTSVVVGGATTGPGGDAGTGTGVGSRPRPSIKEDSVDERSSETVEAPPAVLVRKDEGRGESTAAVVDAAVSTGHGDGNAGVDGGAVVKNSYAGGDFAAGDSAATSCAGGEGEVTSPSPSRGAGAEAVVSGPSGAASSGGCCVVS
eukprot:g10920.t1